MEATIAQDLVNILEDCGCEPDAAVSGPNEHEAYVFKDDYFIVYDTFKSHRQIKETQTRIEFVWKELDWPVDSGFSTNKHHILIKDQTYFIYDFEKELKLIGNTSEWSGFPETTEAVESFFRKDAFNNTTNPKIHLRAYTQGSVHFCTVMGVNSTSHVQYDVKCFRNNTSEKSLANIRQAHKLVGSPIAAVVNLLNGTRIIFGADSYCIEVEGSFCDPSCNPFIFSCPAFSFWCKHFVIFIAVPLALAELGFGIWLCLQKGSKRR